ncbi:hypothetical protein [Parapedobacter pyrenivorans]|nr:hypothetical protein [Parapedobacter pyrenivorans]
MAGESGKKVRRKASGGTALTAKRSRITEESAGCLAAVALL